MIRLITAILACLLTLTDLSYAADSAERRIIGFSPDGKWFAFEQFGVQDGSGFVYHDVFVIDLDNDKWATGTPVEVFIKDENATLHEARNQARSKAAATLAKLRIVDPGRLLASNPVTETIGDPKSIKFKAYRELSSKEHDYALQLEPFPLPGIDYCEGLVDATRGFALSINKRGGPTVEVYRDTAIPNSRGCAVDYAISDVIAANNPLRPTRFVVILHVYSYGFEGFDSRFIALPVTAP